MNGDPWEYKAGFDYALTRHFMLAVLDEMTNNNWEILCSADVSSKYVLQAKDPDYPADVHGWFLAYTGGAELDAEVKENGIEAAAGYSEIAHADSEATDSQVDQIQDEALI